MKKRAQDIHYLETRFGFEYGAASITRAFSDEKKGWVVLVLRTPKADIQLYITKTGKVRVYDTKCGRELL